MPAFSSSVDCTPWVIGGLWPAGLSTAIDETATLAAHLDKDLHQIAGNANRQLGMIKRAGLTEMGRRAGEARIIDDARARAVRRVESTIRQLEMMKTPTPARRQTAHLAPSYRTADLDTTQVIPTVSAAQPDVDAPAFDETQVLRAVTTDPDAEKPDASGGRHRAPSE